MKDQFYEVNMAFSAILLCLQYVDDIAKKDEKDIAQIEKLLATIIKNEIVSTEQLYDGIDLIKGYQLFLHQLDYHTVKNNFIMRYLFGVLSLEKKLMSNHKSVKILTDKIMQLKRQWVHSHGALTDSNMVSAFSNVYIDVISPVGNKIHIVGDPNVIKIPYNQQLIRALLFSAIRSAVLWRQIGGKKRHFLFYRKKIIASISKQINHSS